MRLLCVKEVKTCIGHFSKIEKPVTESPQIGETYNSIKEWDFEDGRYYELSEFPRCPAVRVWHNSMFAMVSQVDEMELVNHKEKVYAR